MKKIQYRLMVLALRAAKGLAVGYARGTGNPPRNILADAEGDSGYGACRREGLKLVLAGASVVVPMDEQDQIIY